MLYAYPGVSLAPAIRVGLAAAGIAIVVPVHHERVIVAVPLGDGKRCPALIPEIMPGHVLRSPSILEPLVLAPSIIHSHFSPPLF